MLMYTCFSSWDRLYNLQTLCSTRTCEVYQLSSKFLMYRPPASLQMHADLCVALKHLASGKRAIEQWNPIELHASIGAIASVLLSCISLCTIPTPWLILQYRIAQKFRGSKFSRIAVFENFVEIIRDFIAPNTPRPHCLCAWRVEILSHAHSNSRLSI